MAVANTLAGIRGGARQVEVTINGIGERAGNAALEELAMIIHVRRDSLPLYTDIHSEELFASSQLLTRLTGMAVQRNKAIVGRNAFARSGNPPGWRAQKRDHLRNHYAADGGHAVKLHRVGKTLRPARFG
jgi:hypothetical protein